MQFENLAKLAGICIGVYATYKVTHMILESTARARRREMEKREEKLPAVTRLIDNLELYGEHVAKRVAILKMRLNRKEITLEEYNVELLALTH